MPIIRFDVLRSGGGTTIIPESLAQLEEIDPAMAARDRLFEMKINHSSTPVGHTINDKTYDMMRIDFEVPLGDLEVWTFRNTSFLPHPMHMHGAQFRVLDRNGSSKLAPTDLGWKDVVYVRPFQEVRVMVRFSQHTGTLLVHCHNLEHEDSGMMLNFAMVDSSSGVDMSVPEHELYMNLR
jgi:FtsP/CotA-like multicopper oxidase with cupredoxin domain